MTGSLAPEDLDIIRQATPATPDLICWLWAAVPPKNDRLHVARCAEVLHVHPTTIRRWVKRAHDKQLSPDAMAILKPRAFLRGRGHPLWPPIDAATRARENATLIQARRRIQMLTDGPPATSGLPQSDLKPHDVHVVYHRRAHVYRVITTGPSGEMLTRALRLDAELIDSRTVNSRYHAQVTKAALLEQAGAARCIPPRSLLASGRTECWRLNTS